MIRGRLSLIVVAGGFGAARGASAAGTDLAESGCSASFVVLSARQPRRESARTARIAIDSVLRIFTKLPNLESTESENTRRSRCRRRRSLKLNTPTPMILVKGLRKSIRNGTRTVDILKGLDFTIPRGQFAAVMGASGSGKSTL